MRHNVKILDVETGQKIMTLKRIQIKKISKDDDIEKNLDEETATLKRTQMKNIAKDNDIEKNLEKETLKKIMTLKRI